MKLKTKLSLSLSLLVLLLTAGVSSLYLLSLVRTQLRGINRHAEFVARAVFNEVRREMRAAAASGQFQPGNPAQVAGFMRNLGRRPALGALFDSAIGYPVSNSIRDVAITQASGQIVADSNPVLIGQPHPPRPRLAQILRAGSWRQIRAIFGPERVYEIRLPMQLGATRLGAVRVGVDTIFVHHSLDQRLHAIVLTAVLVVALSTLLAVVFSDFLLAPLNQLSRQLDLLARGEHSEAAPERRDEYGLVSSKIAVLGQQMRDARQVYFTLEQNLSRMLESIEDGVILLDEAGRIRLASAAAQRLLGRDEAALRGQSIEAAFPENTDLDQAIRAAVRQGQPLNGRVLTRAPGQTPLAARLEAATADRAGERLLLLQDAAQRQQLEDEWEVARRLAAIGRLSRGVAHEVKNPLNALAIHLDLVAAKLEREPAPQVAPHLEVMRHEIERLDRVVRTFLDFTRPVELRRTALDLNQLAVTVHQLMQARAQAEGIGLELRLSGEPLPVSADRDLAEQALLNLVGNALEALPPRQADKQVILETGGDSASLYLRVRDNGPGVAEAIRPRIFDLYFSTREGGSGIGLALAARIMELHQGGLELEPDDPGRPGASFRMHFPRRREERLAVNLSAPALATPDA